MVDYEYQGLFYKNSLPKDIIIVDSGASITKVTGDAPIISDAQYIFTTKDFKTEEFELEESICSEDDLHFGLCESAGVSFVVKNNPDYPNLKNAEAQLDVYFYHNGDSDTLFQVGSYLVDSDVYSDDRRFREIKMYDILYYLRDYNITSWYNKAFKDGQSHTIKDLRDDLFDWLDEQLIDENYTIVQDSEATLVNDNYLIGKTIESDIVTFGFFMQGILEINGCFGHINRLGEFTYKTIPWYSEQAVKVITDGYRQPPTRYEDITTIGIGFVDVYDQNNIQKWHIGSTNFKRPSIYNIVNSFVFADKALNDSATTLALQNMREKVTHLRYKPCEVKTMGNPCLEVGDQIEVQYGEDAQGNPLTFYTYILERRLTGIQSLRDVFSAKGQKRQPSLKLEHDSNWQIGTSEIATNGQGNGGVSVLDDEYRNNFVKAVRNIGIRLLDEPSNVSVEYIDTDQEVQITWNDPVDYSTSEPESVEWAGTVVVRSENNAPWFRWDDATLVVNSTTRNQYASTPLVDSYLQDNKKYYYGIFPYDTNGRYNFTKIVCVDTQKEILVPTIEKVYPCSTGIQLIITFPNEFGSAQYFSLVAVCKKDGIPINDHDGVVKDIYWEAYSNRQTFIVIDNLDESSHYYITLFGKTNDTYEDFTSNTVDVITNEGIIPVLQVNVRSDAGLEPYERLQDEITGKNPILNSNPTAGWYDFSYDTATKSLKSDEGAKIYYGNAYGTYHKFEKYSNLTIKKVIYTENVQYTTETVASYYSWTSCMAMSTSGAQFTVNVFNQTNNPNRIYPYQVNGHGYRLGTLILNERLNAFHEVRSEMSLSDDGVPTKVEIFIDNTLFISDELSDQSTFNFQSIERILVEQNNDCYIKSFSVGILV